MSRARQLADSADLNFDSGTLVIDSANNRVGIGEASPTVPLDVQGNIQASTYLTSPLTSPESAGGTPSDLNTGELGPGYLNLNRDDTAAVNQIQFGKNGAVAAAFETGANDLRIKVNGNTERLRIDSSGNLLVGKTASGTQSTVDGIELREAGFLFVTKSNDAPAYFHRRSSDGDIVQFRKDGTTVGKIGVFTPASTDYLYTGSGDTNLTFFDDNKRISPAVSEGGASNGVIDLGQSNRRFKDLYLSGGVYLGGTGAANYLDDYEEGTFQVTLTGSTSGSANVGDNATRCFYQKVGRMVYITGEIHVTDKSTLSGSIVIGNLPFVCTDTTELSERSVGTLLTRGMSVPANTINLGVFIFGGQSSLRMRAAIENAAWQDLQDSDLATADEFVFSIMYRTSD